MADAQHDHNPQPETIGEYFLMQVRKLLRWIKPTPDDALAVSIIKTILKSIVMLVLIAFSPVVIIILTVAFFAAL
jgi:hypothetical protein